MLAVKTAHTIEYEPGYFIVLLIIWQIGAEEGIKHLYINMGRRGTWAVRQEQSEIVGKSVSVTSCSEKSKSVCQFNESIWIRLELGQFDGADISH